jgi:ribosomal protein S14
MRKRYLVKKDVTSRKHFFNQELRRQLLKAMIADCVLPFDVRQRAFTKLVSFGKRGVSVRMKNRCIRYFALSRITFRETVSHGHLTGVKKAS